MGAGHVFFSRFWPKIRESEKPAVDSLILRGSRLDLIYKYRISSTDIDLLSISIINRYR